MPRGLCRSQEPIHPGLLASGLRPELSSGSSGRAGRSRDEGSVHCSPGARTGHGRSVGHRAREARGPHRGGVGARSAPPLSHGANTGTLPRAGPVRIGGRVPPRAHRWNRLPPRPLGATTDITVSPPRGGRCLRSPHIRTSLATAARRARGRRHAAGEPVTPRRRTWPSGLTDREVEVLRLITQGKSNSAVAAELVISPKTVGRHIENIYSKIGVSSRAAAAVFAVQHELASPQGVLGD